jgi:hypothetical protein
MEPEQKPSGRENMLAIALAMLVGGVGLFFLYMISLGIVGHVLAGAGAIALLATLHYFVWGRAFSQEVEAERAALRRREQAEEIAKPTAPPGAIQDLSRVQGIQKK